MKGIKVTNYRYKIKAGHTNHQYFRDLWSYRELFFFLAWRDILVRYKQTIIGISWSVCRPLITMIVLTIVFRNIAKLSSNDVPYPIMVLAGLLPWQFLSNTLNEGGNSLIVNANMVSKVYFPRIIIPTTSMIVSLIDFLISFCILMCLMAVYLFTPNWKMIFVPFFLLLGVIISLGITYIVSALNVKYRDFKILIPFIIQFGLYLSPVGFSSAVIPEKWRFIYSLNPMVGVIDGFRWSILSTNTTMYWPGFFASVMVAIIIFITSIKIFRNIEREIADII